jgi:mgtE-like transporter
VPEALRDLGEILPALGFASVGALGAGALLGAMTPHLRAAPGVLVIVPGLMALRGNINGAMGARLGSAVHLGLLEPEDPFGPVARANVLASLCLSLAVGAAVGGLGWLLSVIAGLPAISLVRLTLIGAVTGLLSGLALAVVTLAIVVTATLRGIDPDNVTGPLLTVVGDVITMGILFVVLGVLG